MTPSSAGRARRASLLLAALSVAVAACTTTASGSPTTTADRTPAPTTPTTAPPPTTPTTTTTTLPPPTDITVLPSPPPSLEPLPFADLPVDRTLLRAAFAEAGVRMPASSAMLVVAVFPGESGTTYLLFEAGQGADWSRYWPASAVKLLAATAALHRLANLGFDETVTVRFGDGSFAAVETLVRNAVVHSSNPAADRLTQLASPGYLANVFGPTTGLDGIAMGTAFTDINVHDRRPLRIQQGDGEPTVVEQPPGPTRQNAATLRQLVDVLRRIVLPDRVHPEERLGLPASSLALLREAACSTETRFFARAAETVFGDGVTLCGKAGWNENRCVEATWIDPPGSTYSVFLAGVDERTAGCGNLARAGEAALRAVVEAVGLQPGRDHAD
jgi:hypothetical protein